MFWVQRYSLALYLDRKEKWRPPHLYMSPICATCCWGRTLGTLRFLLSSMFYVSQKSAFRLILYCLLCFHSFVSVCDCLKAFCCELLYFLSPLSLIFRRDRPYLNTLPMTAPHVSILTLFAISVSWGIRFLKKESPCFLSFASRFITALRVGSPIRISCPRRFPLVWNLIPWYFPGRRFLEFGDVLFSRTMIAILLQFISIWYLAPTFPNAVSCGETSPMFVVLIARSSAYMRRSLFAA